MKTIGILILLSLLSFSELQAADLQYCASNETKEIILDASSEPVAQDMWKEYFPLLQVMPSGLSCSIQLDKIEQYAAAYCEKRGNYLSVEISDRLISSNSRNGRGTGYTN